MDVVASRYDVYLVNLDPTIGTEIQKTRPCVVVSPNEMNRPLGTVIIAPLTSTLRGYASRVKVRFNERDGQVALDQIRAVDKIRLVKHLGKITRKEGQQVLAVLQEIFAE